MVSGYRSAFFPEVCAIGCAWILDLLESLPPGSHDFSITGNTKVTIEYFKPCVIKVTSCTNKNHCKLTVTDGSISLQQYAKYNNKCRNFPEILMQQSTENGLKSWQECREGLVDYGKIHNELFLANIETSII